MLFSVFFIFEQYNVSSTLRIAAVLVLVLFSFSRIAEQSKGNGIELPVTPHYHSEKYIQVE